MVSGQIDLLLVSVGHWISFELVVVEFVVGLAEWVYTEVE